MTDTELVVECLVCGEAVKGPRHGTAYWRERHEAETEHKQFMEYYAPTLDAALWRVTWQIKT